MRYLADHPVLFGAVTFIVLWLATWIGATVLPRLAPLDKSSRDEFGIVQAATLTLLGLIIGFTFSMATSRYDQRKNYEEDEANAIGTAYVRVELLPAPAAAKLRPLLRSYLEQRILFYTLTDAERLHAVDSETARLQGDLWAATRDGARSDPSPVTALAVASINDVLNSQGYTQAAWWNRIPVQAWILMAAIAICSSALLGYGAGHARAEAFMMPVLPLVVAIAFLLIADIESPRSGTISITARNLQALAQSLRAP
jgi:hypothetical protein